MGEWIGGGSGPRAASFSSRSWGDSSRWVVWGPGGLAREGELAVVADAQSSRRQGRARNIAAQCLEAQPVLGGDAGGRVQGEAARGEAQRRRAHPCGRISQHPSKPQPGALPGGGEAAHGSGGDGGQNGLFVGQGIGLGVVEQAALLSS